MSATHSRFGASAAKVPLHRGRHRPGRLAAAGGATAPAAADTLQTPGLHQPRHPLAPDTLALGMQLGANPGRPMGPAGAGMDGLDLLRQLRIPPRPGRYRALQPRMEPARGECAQPAHRGHKVTGPVHPLRPRRLRRHRVGLPGDTSAAAFARISRPILSRRFSLRSRRSSSRSGLVRPSPRRPSSRSACRTRLRVLSAAGSNSRASESGLRPARYRLHHLPPELRRIRFSRLRHRRHLLLHPKASGVHESVATPDHPTTSGAEG